MFRAVSIYADRSKSVGNVVLGTFALLASSASSPFAKYTTGYV
jgi:hypothetical protein